VNLSLNIVEKSANALRLDVLGGFHPNQDDPHLAGFGTLLLLGPLEPAFWDHFRTQKEYLDKTPNPVDRWSSRVVTALATALGGHPFFPFSGPPYMPFFDWALRTEQCHKSPVNLLVHDHAGLFVSFRGALALRQKLSLPAPTTSPCKTCTTRACIAACPVQAFEGGTYNVEACRHVIQATDPSGCLIRGCAVRRACPISQAYGRLEEQSSYHMRVFAENDL
jgi:hypothetical protein